MKKLFLLGVLVMGLFAAGHAQKAIQETVYLKNGNVIKGNIVEIVPEKSMVIATSDGGAFSCSMSEVRKITRKFITLPKTKEVVREIVEKPMPVCPAKKEKEEKKNYKGTIKGYTGSVEVGGAAGVASLIKGNSIDVMTTHGYQFNPYFFLGSGIALHYNADEKVMFVPVYLDAKVNFVNKAVSPFVDMKGGYSVGNYKGAYFNPSFGVNFKVDEKVVLSYSVGYVGQYASKTQFNYHYVAGDNWSNISGITMRFGVYF